MNPEELKRERISGWALAVVLFVHMVVLRGAPGVSILVFVLLLLGAVLRLRGIYAPNWLGRILLLAGTVLVAIAQVRLYRISNSLGEVAGMAGALMLLRFVTPARGLRILLCLLLLVLAISIQSVIDGTFLIVDVVVFMILAEQLHRPPEAALGIWASLLRSLRVVIPVSLVVTTIFYLFPNFAPTPNQIISGFGGDSINPGAIAEIAQSRRVAMTVHFPEGMAIPRPLDVYWRGQVLEKNDELKWWRDSARVQPRALSEAPPDSATWRYTADLTSNLGGILPVLDRGVAVAAWRGGVEVVVQDLGASVFSVVGTGALRLQVASAADRVSDEPVPSGGGALDVPRRLQDDPALWEIVGRVIQPGRPTGENLRALGDYFRDAGFSYSMHPGKVPTLKYFLLQRRVGFCEHYAAAAANLLRLGGLPARVVTGYRGGIWNPWSRTITVRDSEAHAWVEVWDESSRRWLRFDPTDYIAPDFTARLARNLDSQTWPWYRLALSFLMARITGASDLLDAFFARVEASGFWDFFQPVLFGGYVLFATIWLVRRLRRQRIKNPADLALRLLADLEHQSGRNGRRRVSGETPLAWLARLGRGARPGEAAPLREFARLYEAAVYGRDGTNPDLFASLRRSARHVRQMWKTPASAH